MPLRTPPLAAFVLATSFIARAWLALDRALHTVASAVTRSLDPVCDVAMR